MDIVFFACPKEAAALAAKRVATIFLFIELAPCYVGLAIATRLLPWYFLPRKKTEFRRRSDIISRCDLIAHARHGHLADLVGNPVQHFLGDRILDLTHHFVNLEHL